MIRAKGSILLAVVVSISLSFSACGGSGKTHSIEAVCTARTAALSKIKSQLDSSSSNEGPGGFISGLSTLVSLPHSIAVMTGDMAAVAPEDIRPDLLAVQSSYQQATKDMGSLGTDPIGALVNGIVSGLAVSDSQQRVDEWLQKNCGVAALLADPTPVTSTTQPSTPDKLTPEGELGKILADRATGTAVCDAALNGGNAPDPPDPGTKQAPPNQASVYSRNGVSDGNRDPLLMPHGEAIYECHQTSQSGVNQGKTTVYKVAFDLFGRRILWKDSLSNPDDQFVVGTKFVYKLVSATKPASGLQSAVTTWSIAALDPVSGRQSWSSDFPAQNPDRSNRNPIRLLSEDPDSDLVIFDDEGLVTAYSFTSGKYEWSADVCTQTQFCKHPRPGKGRTVLSNDRVENEYNWEAFDVRTGTQLWTHSTLECESDSSVQGEFALISRAGECLVVVNIADGKVVANKRFNRDLFAFSSTGVLTYDGTNLKYFEHSNPETPKWSEPAGRTIPLVVSDTLALVNGPTGGTLVRIADGSFVGNIEINLEFVPQNYAIDGLFLAGLGSIIELAVPSGTTGG